MSENTRSLKDAAIAYCDWEVSEIDKDFINEIIEMLAHFDSRFMAWPLLAAPFVSDCVRFGKIDTQELQALLTLLRTVDQLKGR